MKVKQTAIKCVTIFSLCLIAISAVLIAGCGSDNTASQNWKITALNSTLGAPVFGRNNCYQPVKFLVTDPSGAAANGIQVDIHTGILGTLVLKHAGMDGCAAAIASGASYKTLTTENDGTVSLDFVVTPTATEQTFFIYVSSGAAIGAELKTAASTT